MSVFCGVSKIEEAGSIKDVEMTDKIQAPNSNLKLDPKTKLGYVHLTISDMERAISFYQNVMGFQVHQREGDTTYLGSGSENILALTEVPGATLIPRRTGLYHFAVLTPSRRALGKSLQHLIETETPLQGGADHLVSEALYLSDPDGNGIEIYRDRPRSEWQYENGNLKMGTEPLDYRGIINETNGDPGEWTGLEPSTRLGHIHLHVADLKSASDFYENVLGFDFLINYMGSAAFLSVGGYHHHIGLNIWNGIGTPPPPPDSAGLRYFSIQLVGEEEQKRLEGRFTKNQINFEVTPDGLFVRDPSQNGILFILGGGDQGDSIMD
jgi:catechol 2,3-dioxygenase